MVHGGAALMPARMAIIKVVYINTCMLISSGGCESDRADDICSLAVCVTWLPVVEVTASGA